MKHYHRNIAESGGFWPSREYFHREWRKLDPQPGESFALFDRDGIRALILCEKLVPGQKRETIPCKKIYLVIRGFQQSTDDMFDVYDLETYSDIVQIDPHRFHVLDKQIAMLNAQLNAYKCELEKLLTN